MRLADRAFRSAGLQPGIYLWFSVGETNVSVLSGGWSTLPPAKVGPFDFQGAASFAFFFTAKGAGFDVALPILSSRCVSLLLCRLFAAPVYPDG
jgi:hypothetical protein